MSDEQIRQILIERKRQKRRLERREEIRAYIEGCIACAGLLWICFMLTVIGG